MLCYNVIHTTMQTLHRLSQRDDPQLLQDKPINMYIWYATGILLSTMQNADIGNMD